MTDAQRRRLAEATYEIAGDEPEILLRVAAVRIGTEDDEGGIEALLGADRLLRAGRTVVGPDQFLFVQSELEFGAAGRLTVGRVAAGICLLAAASPAEQLPYLRDDLLDELRHNSGWIGAHAERAFLQEVFRALERARKARPGRPARAA